MIKYVEISLPRSFIDSSEGGTLSFYLKDNELIENPTLITNPKLVHEGLDDPEALVYTEEIVP